MMIVNNVGSMSAAYFYFDDLLFIDKIAKPFDG